MVGGNTQHRKAPAAVRPLTKRTAISPVLQPASAARIRDDRAGSLALRRRCRKLRIHRPCSRRALVKDMILRVRRRMAVTASLFH
jgi:hypothetical protein